MHTILELEKQVAIAEEQRLECGEDSRACLLKQVGELNKIDVTHRLALLERAFARADQTPGYLIGGMPNREQRNER